MNNIIFWNIFALVLRPKQLHLSLQGSQSSAWIQLNKQQYPESRVNLIPKKKTVQNASYSINFGNPIVLKNYPGMLLVLKRVQLSVIWIFFAFSPCLDIDKKPKQPKHPDSSSKIKVLLQEILHLVPQKSEQKQNKRFFEYSKVTKSNLSRHGYTHNIQVNVPFFNFFLNSHCHGMHLCHESSLLILHSRIIH